MTAVKQGQGGVSLIEILIVIALLGVLAGVGALALREFVDRSEVGSCRIERRVIATAIEAARADNARDEYPPVAGIDGLDGLRATGLLEWQPTPAYWNYVPAPGGGAGETALLRVDTAAVAEADCPSAPGSAP